MSGKLGVPFFKAIFFEVGKPEYAVGHCSDDGCECGMRGDPIPKGEGYLYVSPEVVESRKDCLSVAEYRLKLERMASALRTNTGADQVVFAIVPVLCCEKSACRRNLDLEVAKEDARRWWDTGEVPLRPTPQAAKT